MVTGAGNDTLMALSSPLEAVKKTVLDVGPIERLFRARPLR
jgi:hypothetical protein